MEEYTAQEEPLYMNIHTGSVDTYDGWWYDDEDGNSVNAVDRGELTRVFWDIDEGNWKEWDL